MNMGSVCIGYLNINKQLHHTMAKLLDFLVEQQLSSIVHDVSVGHLQQVWKHLFHILKGMDLWQQDL